jgi:hypothetical protein
LDGYELIPSQHADGVEVPKALGSEMSSDLVVWLYTGEFLASGCLMSTYEVTYSEKWSE